MQIQGEKQKKTVILMWHEPSSGGVCLSPWDMGVFWFSDRCTSLKWNESGYRCLLVTPHRAAALLVESCYTSLSDFY